MYWLFGLLALVVVLGLVLWLGVFMGKGDPRPLGDTSTFEDGPRRGFSVWRYESQRWVLEEDKSEPGFEPGPPPTEAGRFDGYCMKVPSVPKREAR